MLKQGQAFHCSNTLLHEDSLASLHLPSSITLQYQDHVSAKSLCVTSSVSGLEDKVLPEFVKPLSLIGEHSHLPQQEEIITSTGNADVVRHCLSTNDLATYADAYFSVCKYGLESDNLLGNQFLRFLSENGCLQEATRLFAKLHNPDIYAWCAYISAYAENGQENRAICMFNSMLDSRVVPDGYVFQVVLKACASISALSEGRAIHHYVISCSIECNIFVGGALLDMYIKCKCLMDALRVFEDLPEQDVVTWSTLLAGYAGEGLSSEAMELYSQMQKAGCEPSPITYISVLKACSSIPSLEQGRITHSSIVNNGFDTNLYLVNALINMYTNCGSFEDAVVGFHKQQYKDVGTWNSLIGACAQHSKLDEALTLFHVMQDEGVEPGPITFVNILSTCAQCGALDKGRVFHASATEFGFESDMYIGSTLIHVYVNGGCLEEARLLFEKLASPNVVTWGIIIRGYAEHGPAKEALLLFRQMQEAGVELDQAILVCVLKATSSLSLIDDGRTFHALAVEADLEFDEAVGNSLLTMYRSCGCIDAALLMFNRLPQRDTRTWNTLISGLALDEHVHGSMALKVFWQMLEEAMMEPDQGTLVIALKLCSLLFAVNQGILIHRLAVESGLELDLTVGNTLIHMYAKWGSLDEACCLLHRLPQWDTVTLNGIVDGLGQSGHVEQALFLFEELQEHGIHVDDASFGSVLSACSHGGLIKEGCLYFKFMERVHGIVPKALHYSLMVDLKGQAGLLREAEDLLECMPMVTGFVGWVSLLTHCQTYMDVGIGRRCFTNAVMIDPTNASCYVLMSNLYANAGMLEEARDMERLRMGTSGAIKKPGKASIEINDKVHVVTVGEACHPRSDAVRAKLKELIPQVKSEGYVPRWDLVHGDISQDRKEASLWGHAEKLAIAFGLLSTPAGTSLRVSKNLRVCADCHNATKTISKIEKRDIFIMDTYCMHHFREGDCSCEELS